MYILDVFVSKTNLKIGNSFKYLSYEYLPIATRVRINFHNRLTLGFVDNIVATNKSIEELKNEYGYKFKFIEELVDEKPIITTEIYELAKWMSKVTISPFVSCLNTVLPKINSVNMVIDVVNETWVKKVENNKDIKLTKRQQEVYEEFDGECLLSKHRQKYKSITNKLIELGLLEKFEKYKDYRLNEPISKTVFKTLNEDQKLAFDYILETEKIVTLLFGITGSGKTEVYLHLTRKIINDNRQVLIMVPEISLTPQMIERVSQRFDRVCFYHSGLSKQEQFNQYLKVLNKEVDVVVGTRSSIFLPFEDLGLIIIDEEHDHSYSQNKVPCYHVRDIAIKRAIKHKAKVVLASATPSLRSYALALNKTYGLVKLPNRINKNLPDIKLVDPYEEFKKGTNSIIGSYLRKRIDEELKINHQIIILLNRRGYNPILKCGSCKEVLKCNDCDVALVYHQDERVLKCHYCGRIYNYPRSCQNCGQNTIVSYGYGTKKVEELFNQLYPNASIARFDRDSVNKKGAHQKILSSFEKHEIDILIGTQMIAKGLDYPKVSLVGILDGDQGFKSDNYQAMEDVFDLLMQASGRSGRSDIKGEVVVQTQNSDHYLFKALINNDYEAFFKQEMKFRSYLNYPPYTHILSLILEARNENKLDYSIKSMVSLINKYNLKAFKPCILNTLNKYMRARILIIDKDIKKLVDLGNKIIDEYFEDSGVVNVIVEMDPLEI